MASRPIVPLQQQRGEAVVGEEKGKQKVVRGGGNNRRALGDIHNLVQQQQQMNRPITRSFCAQLLANAQAAAEENNIKKKQVPVVVDRLVVPKVAKAAPQKKVVTVKPKPNEVIEISPDTVEKPTTKEIRNASPLQQRASKKKVNTLTAVLTARSKAACGIITNKSKDPIMNIDAGDVHNELAAVEYVEDIFKYYKGAESSSQAHDYMDSQPDINEKMRAILVDWLIEVHNKFELMPESLYLTVNLVDRYLSMKTVPRRELQLVGISAMLIASKYEEIWAPEVNDFVCISDKAYTREQILVMEKLVLGKLEWTITVPTHYVFLARFIKAAIADQEMEHMVYFLAELALMNYASNMYCPSMVAASAVYAARGTLNKTPLWTETLKFHSGFSEPQLIDCAKLLVTFHSGLAENKLQVIFRKYSHPQRSGVALLPPAKNLLA